MDRDKTMGEFNELRENAQEVGRYARFVEDKMNKMDSYFCHAISIACDQGMKWFLGSRAFQDVVNIFAMSNTIGIYNKVWGKVLQHYPNFPIGELTFVDSEEIDEHKKSLAPLFNTTTKLK